MGLHIALVHHPVLAHTGEVVTTAITSLDIHDVARTARTYGVERTFMVSPITQQRALAEYVQSHWLDNPARASHPRAEALSRVRVVASVDDAVSEIAGDGVSAPYVVATSAKRRDGDTTFAELRDRLGSPDTEPTLLLFGTGWGLADPWLSRADAKLEPVGDEDDYNHLSVRAAVAVILDRLSRA